MRKKTVGKTLIGILCVLILLAVVAVALLLDSRSPDPIFGIFRPEPTVDSSDEQVTLPGPDELPPSVVVPTEKDPQTGESIVTFPCEIAEYNLVIEKIAPYSGMFVEDGTNADVENVAMLLVHNNSEYPVEFTQISVNYGNEQLLFDISGLPAGEMLVAQEKNRKPAPEDGVSEVTALVVQRTSMDMSEGKVSVRDNGDNSLTIENLTDKTIPTVRVFYKYYMEKEKVFVGGIAFTVRVTGLAAGAKITVQPSHYTSESSRVVMVQIYDSEV